MHYSEILKKLWNDYRKLNPNVDRIHSLLEKRGEQVVNDHIALRTYDLPGINIDIIAQPFIDTGYAEKGRYTFEEKHLNAKHFEHQEDKNAPKVFVSELITKEFSPLIQETAHWVAKEIIKKKLTPLDILFSERGWSPINFASYEALRKESEYAAWLYVFGFRANHFTVFINHLKSIGSIEDMNNLLKENNFELNSAGGEIKGSKQELLKQSSTLADRVMVNFEDDIRSIPCCYYEFAERFVDDTGNLFSGFIAKSADKIFESTNKK